MGVFCIRWKSPITKFKSKTVSYPYKTNGETVRSLHINILVYSYLLRRGSHIWDVACDVVGRDDINVNLCHFNTLIYPNTWIREEGGGHYDF